MPQWLKLYSLTSVVLISACMPIESLREAPVAVSQPAKERVIIHEVTKPEHGCGSVLTEYLNFTRYNEDVKRQEIRTLKKRINTEKNGCDSLRLALFHSAPGKLRQTDDIIFELLDGLVNNTTELGSNDHALIGLLRNEMHQRSVVEKKVSLHNQRLDQERAENRQLLQRLAELQLQLDQLKSLETNIDPE